MAGTGLEKMVARWQWAALALSLAVAVLLAGLGAVESEPEWVRYQREYAQVVAHLPGSITQTQVSTARRAEELQPEIRQIEIAALNRVDRCTTCHLGVANSQMADAPLPFTAHPALLDSHPPEHYGCTICHGGEGRAVTVAEAHGETPGQQRRLIPAVLRPSACYACHGLETLPAADMTIVAEGIKLINEYKCLRCHQLDGSGGSIGPDLTGIASQRNWVGLYAHLLKPAALTPGSTMPDFGLHRREATAITAFLLTRLSARDRVMDVTYLTSGSAPTGTPATTTVIPSAESLPAPNHDGRELFAGLECSVCHRVGLAGGEVGPALTHIGRARDAAWLRDLLADPARVFPEGQMPAYDLSEAQVMALVDYLMTLK
jgi:cbb3-type cytochrome oxidase cytochrome c subunit